VRHSHMWPETQGAERADAHTAAANLETERGGVIHRFPYASGGLPRQGRPEALPQPPAIGSARRTR
jgi:hypothetical protein